MIVVQTTFPATPKGPAVPGLLVQPHNPLALMLFGHGAGTPMHAPLMHQMSAALAARGVATFRYNYPYSQRLDVGYTEDLIDPLDVLLATTRAAMNSAQALSPNLPLFLGGRSMSSQVMSLALARQHLAPRPRPRPLRLPHALARPPAKHRHPPPAGPRPHALRPGQPRPRIRRPHRTPTRNRKPRPSIRSW